MMKVMIRALKENAPTGNNWRMTFQEMRVALYLSLALIFNGITVTAFALEAGWGAAILPLMGAIFAALSGYTIRRKASGTQRDA